MSVGVSLLLCLPRGCSEVMLPFASPLFPDLSSSSSVIPTGNPSTWSLSPEGSLGCLWDSHRVMQDLGGLRAKSVCPQFPWVTRKNSRPEKMCFSLLSKTVSLF